MAPKGPVQARVEAPVKGQPPPVLAQRASASAGLTNCQLQLSLAVERRPMARL